MLFFQLHQLLLLLWKLSTVYIIPIIIFAYIFVMNNYFGNFTFNDLDTGINVHKWTVFAIYLMYLLVWKFSNKAVNAYLKKMEY